MFLNGTCLIVKKKNIYIYIYVIKMKCLSFVCAALLTLLINIGFICVIPIELV